ncbi:substrate-binding periplasmic protein [Vibrio tapetis]|uniref:Solute-binding protein family 3/N-terminal domain-containing protein n=1 Tax=Vibrio tapetis subsp. tapetis TaxID=1671868 RepID=A0A2N8ZMI2_9VIBR|nr:transporter substrate-binding domain-containing protein [Vibrio tapetis]SON53141.1 exported protein of unknown function [Vibrio tapetis subsp. tapetis]
MKIIGLMLLTLVCLPLQAKEIKVGIFYLGPHMIVKSEDREHQGYAITHFKDIASKMSIDKVTFMAFPFPRMVYALEHNQIDAALLLAKNSQRSERFVYPEEPYYRTTPGIAVREDFPLSSIETIEDILPFTIGITAKVYRTPMMRDERIKYDRVASGKQIYKQHFSKLEARRIDAIYLPDVEGLKYEADKLGYDQFRYMTLPELPTLVYTVFSKESAKVYLEDYQDALRQQNLSLTYEELVESESDGM